jgi:hypothetical protein
MPETPALTEQNAPAAGNAAAPAVVLDSNVWIDILVFAHSRRARKRRAARANRPALPRRTDVRPRLSAVRQARRRQSRRARDARAAIDTGRAAHARRKRARAAQMQGPRRSEVSRTRLCDAGGLAGLERSRGVEARETDRARFRFPDRAARTVRRRMCADGRSTRRGLTRARAVRRRDGTRRAAGRHSQPSRGFSLQSSFTPDHNGINDYDRIRTVT